MFDRLTERLGDVFGRLTRRGALSEADVDAALREVRVALLEADVALPVVKDFLAKVREGAVGEAVLKSVTPGQMVVKLVHDALVEALGSTSSAINLNAEPPVVIMMVGLQGSGKTTTTAKIAMRLVSRERKRVLMASLDTRRPAAQEQLAVLGRQANVPTLPIVPGEPPVAIAKRALQTGRLEGYDVVMLDTAGDAVGMEILQRLQFFAHADQLDGRAGDRAHGKGGTAAGIAINPGQHDTGQAQAIAEVGGNIHRVLAGHGIDDQQGLGG